MNVLTNSKGRTEGGDVKKVAAVAVVGSNCEKERKKKERDK